MKAHANVGDSANTVGRYAIAGEIASGGMATIYLGHPIAGTRLVAIKRLLKPYASDLEFVTMFLDEVWLASRVRHVNIVEVLDVVSQDGDLSLVMEYVEGETLGRLIRIARERKRFIPLPVVAGIMCGVLEGLHAAHEAKDEQGRPLDIVHRDVSPQNVMIGVDGVPRLLDFGVAKAAVRLQSTRAGQLKGKVAYMAPEQIEHHQISRVTDVYAAGVVLWEALTAKRCFDAENEGQLLHRVLGGPAQPPSAVRSDLPVELDAVVMRAMSRDPRDRYPTARHMAHAIEMVAPLAKAAQIGEWLRGTAQASLEKRAKRVADLLNGPTSSGIPSSGSLVSPPSSNPSVSSASSAPSRPSVASMLSRPSTSSALRSQLRPDPSPSQIPSNVTPTGARTKHVLIIDDSEVILDRARMALEAEGYRVTTTTQTVGAARHLVDCDLAIIDFHMPGIDGGTVIQSLRSACEASGRTCAFYLYTADAAIAKEYARWGFDGCITDKGDDAALVRQLRGAMRLIGMRAFKR